MREEDSGIQGIPLLPKGGQSDTPTLQPMEMGQEGSPTGPGQGRSSDL